jgi:hypothetical protein
MEPESYTKRLLAIWLALPATALDFWLASTRLPERVITKYDEQGRAIGWGSRDGVFTLLAGLLVFFLILSTVIGFVVGTTRPDRMRPVLVVLYLCAGLVFALETWSVWGLAAP